MTVPSISVVGLRASFGGAPVLDGLDLTVAPGTVFALLGPSGAGKTTLVRILSTLVAADAGEVRVGGHDPARDPRAVRALIGVTGRFPAVDTRLTGAENLMLMARLCHLGRATAHRRTADLVVRFGLRDVASRPARTWPAGALRKLDLAMTLVGDPRVVLLDEPTAGLDARARHDVWLAVRNLVRGGATVLLTTRSLDEADHVADRVGVLDRGRLLVEGTPSELKRLVPGGHVSLRFADPVALAVATIELDTAFPRLTRDDETFTLRVPSDAATRSLRDMLDRLDRAGVEVESLELHRPDLDDVLHALREPACTPSPTR
ncbi:ABC transporter ATP-binding protein [Virgisporangium ochraceum]|uniref:Daunorubicin resistance protein DrrA family ABC transporter ATP-binding protein n=1 Tax=Virgisporangium ochraceum TaxID=65505 RepID=A0A8J3ZY92_9ACTN|nr:ATP-binding cassette domain-containing protein [Virgisporangium ochraceum]GIJ71836.1 daunorubicin resistance protein DrrA family ABC transporter ATP-binding protein [Virgisporangium ochraceum]